MAAASTSPKYPGKYKLIPEVVKFCLTSDFFTQLDKFMGEHSSEVGTSKEEEYKLNYTLIHKQYVANFEKQLEDFIKSKGSTPQKFYELCKTAQKHDTAIESFIDLLLQITEFETFIDMARDANKRAYVQQILGMYAKMLGLKT